MKSLEGAVGGLESSARCCSFTSFRSVIVRLPDPFRFSRGGLLSEEVDDDEDIRLASEREFKEAELTLLLPLTAREVDASGRRGGGGGGEAREEPAGRSAVAALLAFATSFPLRRQKISSCAGNSSELAIKSCSGEILFLSWIVGVLFRCLLALRLPMTDGLFRGTPPFLIDGVVREDGGGGGTLPTGAWGMFRFCCGDREVVFFRLQKI